MEGKVEGTRCATRRCFGGVAGLRVGPPPLFPVYPPPLARGPNTGGTRRNTTAKPRRPARHGTSLACHGVQKLQATAGVMPVRPIRAPSVLQPGARTSETHAHPVTPPPPCSQGPRG